MPSVRAQLNDKQKESNDSIDYQYLYILHKDYMRIAQTASAESDGLCKALLILLTLPPILPPRLIIIARMVLDFDSIFTGVDCPAYIALSKLPLAVDERFNIYPLTTTVITRAGTEKYGYLCCTWPAWDW